MLTNMDDKQNVRFVSYSGKYPNLCNGELVLEVAGKEYRWDKYSCFIHSGGSFDSGWNALSGEWEVDYRQIPDEIKQYAGEIDKCINENIEHGCCGGCS